MLTPSIYEGMKSIYDYAVETDEKFIEKSRHDPKIKSQGVLKIFQTCLKDIPSLNNHALEKELSRIKQTCKCSDWFDDLIKAVIKSNIVLLTFSTSKHQSPLVNEKYHERIDPRDFIHKCYIEVAGTLYNNPHLFWHEYPSIEIKRNQMQVYKLIDKAIRNAILKSLPTRFILREYLENDYVKEEDLPNDSQYMNIKSMIERDLHGGAKYNKEDNYYSKHYGGNESDLEKNLLDNPDESSDDTTNISNSSNSDQTENISETTETIQHKLKNITKSINSDESSESHQSNESKGSFGSIGSIDSRKSLGDSLGSLNNMSIGSLNTRESLNNHSDKSINNHSVKSLNNHSDKSLNNHSDKSINNHNDKSINNHNDKSINNNNDKSINNHNDKSINNNNDKSINNNNDKSLNNNNDKSIKNIPTFDDEIKNLLKRNNITDLTQTQKLDKKNNNTKISEIIQQAGNKSVQNLAKNKNNNISESEKSKFFAEFMK
jgi:hypothetical protein